MQPATNFMISGLILNIGLSALMLLILYFIIRAAVRDGIRDAQKKLKDMDKQEEGKDR